MMRKVYDEMQNIIFYSLKGFWGFGVLGFVLALSW